jgi:hypothetical protein
MSFLTSYSLLIHSGGNPLIPGGNPLIRADRADNDFRFRVSGVRSTMMAKPSKTLLCFVAFLLTKIESRKTGGRLAGTPRAPQAFRYPLLRRIISPLFDRSSEIRQKPGYFGDNSGTGAGQAKDKPRPRCKRGRRSHTRNPLNSSVFSRISPSTMTSSIPVWMPKPRPAENERLSP